MANNADVMRELFQAGLTPQGFWIEERRIVGMWLGNGEVDARKIPVVDTIGAASDAPPETKEKLRAIAERLGIKFVEVDGSELARLVEDYEKPHRSAGFGGW